MDTSAKSEEAGKRQFRSLQEKLRIVAEANRPGASVAAVALRNGVNANLVFGWRRLHRRGLLDRQRDATPRLLPVKITMPTLTPSERTQRCRRSANERARRRFPDAWRSCCRARCAFVCTGTSSPRRLTTFSSGPLVDDRAACRSASVAGGRLYGHA